MAIVRSCEKCIRRHTTKWELGQNLTCPTCGGMMKIESVPTGWRPASGYVQENDTRYEEVKDEMPVL